MTYNNDKNKWERQPEEPKSAFKYFSYYLIEQVKNSRDPLQKTADYFERKLKYMQNLSSNNDWQKRAEAYNQYLAEEQQKEFEKEYKEICKDTIMQIRAMSQIIGQKINADILSIKQAKGDKEAIKQAIGNLPMNQVAQVLKINQEVLKTILRIPDNQEISFSGTVETENKNVTNLKNSLDKLSPEERQMYLDLCEKVSEEDVTDSE